FFLNLSSIMYAIVDIETTGGHAIANGITEIAIVLHNGKEQEGRFHTMINPQVTIPRYISALTGITNEMVYDAPLFEQVADKIFNLLQNRIFVAHNVNFDYSFIRHHLLQAGYDLTTRKLCTVRMARKVFPGFASYSLGNLCRELQITITNRHRAMGDTMATVQLFEMVLQNDTTGIVAGMLKGRNKEQYLPPHLPSPDIEQLPNTAGVYYFYNQKKKIVYVGKATNLQQRVKSHFSNNDSSKRKQEFLRNIHSVSCRECSSELAALILESTEIRRLWPQYNRSQKKYHQEYGLYTYEDRNGYLRLFIEKKKKHLAPVYTFNLLHEGQVLLRKMIEEFELNEALCFVNNAVPVTTMDVAVQYNQKVRKAIQSLQDQLPTFLVTDGEDETANYFLMERGRFVGMGQLPKEIVNDNLESIRTNLTIYPDNDYIRGLLYQFAEKFPEKKIKILSQN
ncbi:MAG: exonuclease domain-containing protein, partial [Bacteroidota bacterium]